jgi:hypothetical protein
VFRFPLSAFRFPLSAFRFLLFAFCFLLSHTVESYDYSTRLTFSAMVFYPSSALRSSSAGFEFFYAATRSTLAESPSAF